MTNNPAGQCCTLRVYHKQHAAQVANDEGEGEEGRRSLKSPTSRDFDRPHDPPHTQESAPYLGVHSDKPKAEDHLSDHCHWTVEHLPKDEARATASASAGTSRSGGWMGHSYCTGTPHPT